MHRTFPALALCVSALCLVAPGCEPSDGDATDAGPQADAAISCDDVICGGNAHCEAGVCVCNEGLVADGDECVEAEPPPLPTPADRTEAAVCAYWAQEHVDVRPEATPGAGMCDSSVIGAPAQENALRRTNLYRWLVGLPPVPYEPALLAGVQACAVVLKALGRLDHAPPDSTACYDPVQAAGRSNLAIGGGMADSVDLYVDDRGVDTLGHRRWVLEPGLGATAFGISGRYSCMDVFTGGGDASVPFIAWPPPGYMPLDGAAGEWSISLWGRRVTPDSVLRIDTGDGTSTQLEYNDLELGYGSASSVISFDVPEALRRDGQQIAVTLDRLSEGAPLAYTVVYTGCGE
ncbi:MAG: hypothetical protein ACI9U2_005242 [Bradymonadia bacterium]|jgi:hypothetical protein